MAWWSASCLLLSCLYVFCFSSSLLLFYFFVWYSHIESARFVIVYHSCVPIPTWHTKKRPMSRLTNPITPSDFFTTGIRLLIFYNFVTFYFDVNRSYWVSTDSHHILVPLIIRTRWIHMYIYICSEVKIAFIIARKEIM